MHGHCRKPFITVYNVVNIDIFLTKTHRFTSEDIYESTAIVWIAFMMGGLAFWSFKSYSMLLQSWKEP